MIDASIYVVLFLISQLLPNGITHFELQVDKGNYGSAVIADFSHNELKFTVDGDETVHWFTNNGSDFLRIDITDITMLDMHKFYEYDDQTDWSSLKSINAAGYLVHGGDTPILINREEKGLRLYQEKGALSELGEMKVRW